MKIKETIEIHVEKGAPNGHKVCFREKGDEHPDIIAGDL